MYRKTFMFRNTVSSQCNYSDHVGDHGKCLLCAIQKSCFFFYFIV